MGIIIRVKEGEPIERAIKKYKKRFEKVRLVRYDKVTNSTLKNGSVFGTKLFYTISRMKFVSLEGKISPTEKRLLIKKEWALGLREY